MISIDPHSRNRGYSARRLAPAWVFGVFLALLCTLKAQGQGTPKPKPSSTGMGVATGAARPAIKDSQGHPITAGGLVDGAPVVFRDITKQAGLDKFLHRSGTPAKKTI